MVKIAVAQYEVEPLPSWQAYEDKMIRLVEQAKERGADLLTLGEYAGLELLAWSKINTIALQFDHLQTLLKDYQQLFLSLAKQYQLYLQPGSLPVKQKNGRYRNRAFLFAPSGKVEHQDKLFLAPFEWQTGCIEVGTELKIFDTALGKVGIMICYDSEFPALTQSLTQQGVKLIIVPSCTEKISGLTRVSVCSRARAIENQCYVAQSSLIGKANWCDFIDINSGESGIYSPADSGFPENGILAQAPLNTPMLIEAELAWDKLVAVRERGEMRNFIDSQKEFSPLLQSIRTLDLT